MINKREANLEFPRPALAGNRRLTTVAITSLILGVFCTVPAMGQRLTTERVVSGLITPLYAGSPPGDRERLFVAEQFTGRIRILKNGVLLDDPFLDIRSLLNIGGEQGLLGVAFHPDYANNGWFFVNYTNQPGDTVVARYEVSAGNPDLADPNSAEIIITIEQPFANHNGGNLAFGPDGFLYIGMGDGGSGGDPGNRAQNGMELLGKMLRLDVSSGLPFNIPADNPFVNDPDVRDEIWALGLRNPWRWSFDRLTGDLYIADVGQAKWEEIDFQPAASPGGENYGWRLKEGNHCFNPPVNCDPGGLTDPIYEYSHGGGRCSITGGFTYRGAAIPLLSGTYFFADFCSNQIWSFIFDGNVVSEFQERTAELDPGGGLLIDNIASFGEDVDGELYIVDISGEIYRIVTAMRLRVQQLIAGEDVGMRVSGATPGGKVFFTFSTDGIGETPVPMLGATLALENPRLAGTAQANGTGTATLVRRVPGVAQGVEVWLQAIEAGNTSNVVTDIVQ